MSEHDFTNTEHTGVILVDHGSRREESNQLLLEVVAAYDQSSSWEIVEPAHMELAEPSIAVAFARCIERGAKRVIVFPYFLSPGRHWHSDIPRLAAAAAAEHGDIPFVVTAPLGLHPLMMEVISQRIGHCLQHAGGTADSCEMCTDSTGCAASDQGQ
ncbi:CbiX/SirB N-terminal domain-containing protein [Adhaeretor mobilis]|uniref:Sirohydrochlorin cobaltochelatase n=1 Tax=Adhaeretor mobilis TaxID=1930276 RepID=A0A517MWW5_9BACT|nr:CbiX/SirB N-terminal domain-containing protein [Adhaeretor mobilis]QDS99368.1 Sirohydrochlorin cobaltochelatase [Adhaeretor mobilis]